MFPLQLAEIKGFILIQYFISNNKNVFVALVLVI